MRRLLLSSLVAVAVPAFALESLGVSEEEFKMYQQYQRAMADARVQAMKPEARLPAIAKDAGFKLPELKKAIEKAEAAGDVKAKCDANLKELVGTGDLAGRTGRLEVDITGEHPVAYVQWFNDDPKNLAVEAATVAARAAEACPIATTVSVFAQDKAAPKRRVFQALISTASARRIKLDRVKDFAEGRYLKLFEKVKNAANGDDLSAESGTPTAKP